MVAASGVPVRASCDDGPDYRQCQDIPPSSNSQVITKVVGGIIAFVVGSIIVDLINKSQQPPQPPSPPPPPPGSSPTVTQVQAPGTPIGPLRAGFFLPPIGAPIVDNEVILDLGNIPLSRQDAIAAAHGMTRIETLRLGLTGHTIHRWRINSGTPVPRMIANMSGDRRIAGATANFVFHLAQGAAAINVDQYAPNKLNIVEAHRLATGNSVLVAVIDSAVDREHPDLAGAVVANYNATGDNVPPDAHGTGMAGAIAARQTIMSVAPRVGLVTVQAFSPKASTAEGTTFNILKALDWAVEQKVRVINMSFAGPRDPRLTEALKNAARKGVVLIAAAGNAGPDSPPLYPAADPNVIAVTATDPKDTVFSHAVRGNHIAVAAPGVDVIVPAPAGAYQFTTGTSVAAAEVSGVVALLIERNPRLTSKDIRAILMRTAKDLGPKGRDRDYGAGLVDALEAVNAASAPTH